MATQTVTQSGPLEVGQTFGSTGAHTFANADALVCGTFTVSLSSPITQTTITSSAAGTLVLCPGADLVTTGVNTLSGHITHAPRMIVTTPNWPQSTTNSTTPGVFVSAGN